MTPDVSTAVPLNSQLVHLVPPQRGPEMSDGLAAVSSVVDVSRFDCCDVRIAALTTDDAVDVLRDRAQRRVGTGVHLCNTYTLTIARDRPDYRAMLNADSLNLADGAPVAWVGRRQGHANLTQPVRGPGLMDAVLRDGLRWGARHYFYGSSPEVVERLGEVLPQKYDGVSIVGLESPPYRPLTEGETVATRQRLARSGAHYVWVGLGTPKQDVFVHEFAAGSRSVVVGIGAAFDFAAGTLREAPALVHGSGLEWLFRLANEPRRLTGRYARSAALAPCLVRSARAHR